MLIYRETKFLDQVCGMLDNELLKTNDMDTVRPKTEVDLEKLKDCVVK